jgi:hypothetical protein
MAIRMPDCPAFGGVLYKETFFTDSKQNNGKKKSSHVNNSVMNIRAMGNIYK